MCTSVNTHTDTKKSTHPTAHPQDKLDPTQTQNKHSQLPHTLSLSHTNTHFLSHTHSLSPHTHTCTHTHSLSHTQKGLTSTSSYLPQGSGCGDCLCLRSNHCTISSGCCWEVRETSIGLLLWRWAATVAEGALDYCLWRTTGTFTWWFTHHFTCYHGTTSAEGAMWWFTQYFMWFTQYFSFCTLPSYHHCWRGSVSLNRDIDVVIYKVFDMLS